MYYKVKYHKNPEVQQAYQKYRCKKNLQIKRNYQKMRYQENPQMQKDFQRKHYKKTPEIKIDYQKMRYQENPQMQIVFQRKRYKESPEIKIEYQKIGINKMLKLTKIIKNRDVKKTKNSDQVESFLEQLKQGPYYICTTCHRNLYQRSVRLCKHEKYNILTPELYHPVKSFDENLYICETCRKHLDKNEIPCQAVCNKLKDLKKLEKVLISKRILFNKIAIMHGKGEFSKIQGGICNVPIETANVCNILPRPSVSNGLIFVKLKRDLKYRGHVYFEPVCPHIIYHVLTYLKSRNKFYEDISVTKGFSGEDMLNFSDINENQEETECDWKWHFG